MSTDDLIYYQYIQTLNEFSKDDIKRYKKQLQLFNEYLSSNRNFKYNKTYLDDSIDNFFKACETFQMKKAKAENFRKDIFNKYKSIGNWYIIVDHFYLIDNNGGILLFNRLKECDSVMSRKEIILKEELQLFNLHNIDNRSVIVKYYLDDNLNQTEYIEKYSITDNIEINCFVKEDLEEIKENE